MKATAQNCKTNSLDSVVKVWMSPTCNLLIFKKFSCFFKWNELPSILYKRRERSLLFYISSNIQFKEVEYLKREKYKMYFWCILNFIPNEDMKCVFREI